MAISRQGGALPPRLPQSSRKLFVARHMGDGKIVLQSPPKKRGAAKSGTLLYQQLMFGWAARQTSILEPTMRQTCEYLAKGTEFTWRDVAMMMILGTYYAVEFSDGTIMEGARLSNPDPQYLLDLVTNVVGSILIRGPLGWVGLPPTTDGDQLTLDAGLPSWQPPGGASGGSYGAASIAAATSSTLFATKGSLLIPLADFQISEVWGAGLWVNGATYIAGLYHLSTLTIDAVVGVSAVATYLTAMAGSLLLDFGAKLPLVKGDRYALAFTRTDATTTTSCGADTTAQVPPGLPLIQTTTTVVMASKAPAVGNAFTSVAGNYQFGVKAWWA